MAADPRPSRSPLLAIRLSAAQLAMLRQYAELPYGQGCPKGQRKRTAEALLSLGLFERCGYSLPTWYGITQAGRDELQRRRDRRLGVLSKAVGA